MTETEVTDKILFFYSMFQSEVGSIAIYKNFYKLLNKIEETVGDFICIDGKAVDFIEASADYPELLKEACEKYNGKQLEQKINIYYKEIQTIGDATWKVKKPLAEISLLVDFDDSSGKPRESISYGITWYVAKYLEHIGVNDTIEYIQIGSYFLTSYDGILYRSI